MADSSAGGDGFFAYYRQYARSGIHGASAAALTALGLWATYTGNNVFILLAIAVYVLPPIFLYLTGEGENVPSVVGDGTPDTAETDRTDTDGGDSAASRTDHESADGPSRTDSQPESDGRPPDSASRADADTTTDEQSRDTADGSEVAKTPSTADVDDSESRSPDATDEPHGSEERSEESADSGWEAIDTPTDQSLLDIVTTHDGAYAVGESGVVLARDEEWEVALDDGPTANANTLRGVDATDDGEAVWFAGDSGVLGRYADGTLTDHSAPKDQTSTWEGVAVTGEAGDERLHLVNGSGELLRGTYENGAVEWGDIEKPGSGSSIAAIEFLDGDRGHLADTNQSVYETTDGGASYEKIGIEDANAAFTGVAASDSETLVAADDGSLFRYDGAVWTRLQPGDRALSAVALAGETGLAAGDGGAVYELRDGNWESAETPVDAALHGITTASEQADVAVGTDGTVIERYR